MKTKINAQIVAHSVNEQGDELISVLATFPRIILAEINTHRMLSKNTSSSRAIPFNKMVETVKNDPFIPIAWQKAHSGMQGTEYLDESHSYQAKLTWLAARVLAIEQAIDLSVNIGVTKQLANRLLEPFMWTTMLITGSREGWENFFNLRCPQYSIETLIDGDTRLFKSKKDLLKELDYEPINPSSDLDFLKMNKGQAEIHIMELAECIWDAYNESTPRVLKAGEWHIPFESKMDIPSEQYINITGKVILKKQDFTNIKVRASVAMAARTSYTVVGEEKAIDYEAMIGLHDRLLAWDPPHSSPMEHCSVCVSQEEYDISFKGQEKGWFRNYKGFKSYRQIIEESR